MSVNWRVASHEWYNHSTWYLGKQAFNIDTELLLSMRYWQDITEAATGFPDSRDSLCFLSIWKSFSLWSWMASVKTLKLAHETPEVVSTILWTFSLQLSYQCIHLTKRCNYKNCFASSPPLQEFLQCFYSADGYLATMEKTMTKTKGKGGEQQ